MPQAFERPNIRFSVYDMIDLFGAASITLVSGVAQDTLYVEAHGAQALSFVFMGTGPTSVWDITQGLNVQPFSDKISADNITNQGSGSVGIAINYQTYTTAAGLKAFQMEVSKQNVLLMGFPWAKVGARIKVGTANLTGVVGKMIAWWW